MPKRKKRSQKEIVNEIATLFRKGGPDAVRRKTKARINTPFFPRQPGEESQSELGRLLESSKPFFPRQPGEESQSALGRLLESLRRGG